MSQNVEVDEVDEVDECAPRDVRPMEQPSVVKYSATPVLHLKCKLKLEKIIIRYLNLERKRRGIRRSAVVRY